MSKEYKKLVDDLQYYYELDLDNCLMTNKDWIKTIALLITNKDYKKEMLKEIACYKLIRE